MILHKDGFNSSQKPQRGRPAGSTQKAKFIAKQLPLFQKESLSRLAGQGVGNSKPVLFSFRTPDHE